jgi:hypothetical protein
MQLAQRTNCMTYALAAGGLLAVALGLYGLHRLALHFERRGIIYYRHHKPTGGGGYNPLQEFVQPEVRHINEVAEHRLEEDSHGGSPKYNGRRPPN